MITRLYIKNFALIDELETHFSKGLNVITGETGAGKSIVIGAIELLLGRRADYSKIGDQANKCIVEGTFQVPKSFAPFFQELDVDYFPQTIVRRELLPEGRGRAFINDSPVNLDSLREITSLLVDVHRQHEILLLEKEHFQFNILDRYAGLDGLLESYRGSYKEWILANKQLVEIEDQIAALLKEKDFESFLLEELDEAQLQENEELDLQAEYELQSHSEAISESLAKAQNNLDGEHLSILSQLYEVNLNLSKLQKFSPQFSELFERVKSCELELKDILREIERLQTNVSHDPEKLDKINARLDRIRQLELKHRVSGTVGLLSIQNSLRMKESTGEELEGKATELRRKIESLYQEMSVKGNDLTEKRKMASLGFEKEISGKGGDVGLKDMVIRCSISPSREFHDFGKDELDILFSANPGRAPEPISKVASGGELSRMMLLIKEMLARTSSVQTMIFDEIDMGISGEVAAKVGTILNSIGQDTQVICITHLPQVAAQGARHLKVKKYQKSGNTFSSLYELSINERIEEISLMLSGKTDSQASIQSAKELLGKA